MPKFHIEETISINAELDKVRDIVGDFRRWTPWSPWVSAEPDCPLSFADDGKSYSWDGKIIGSGGMTIASESDGRIDYKLEFLKPFKSKADVAFTCASKDGQTHVTWLMDSALPFFMFFMLNSVKAAIGADYHRGLVQLKDYAEMDEVPSKNEFVGVGGGIECAYVGLRSSCSTEQSRAGQSRAEQGRAEQSRAEQSRAEQSRAEQSRAEQSRAEQSRAEQSRAEQSRAEQSNSARICRPNTTN